MIHDFVQPKKYDKQISYIQILKSVTYFLPNFVFSVHKTDEK